MKGLLITLVVIGHLPFFDYDSRTLTLIYSFHMPAFLIIGGIVVLVLIIIYLLITLVKDDNEVSNTIASKGVVINELA